MQGQVCSIHAAPRVLSVLSMRVLAHAEWQSLSPSKVHKLFSQQTRSLSVFHHLRFVLRLLNGLWDILQVTWLPKSTYLFIISNFKTGYPVNNALLISTFFIANIISLFAIKLIISSMLTHKLDQICAFFSWEHPLVMVGKWMNDEPTVWTTSFSIVTRPDADAKKDKIKPRLKLWF